MFGAYALGIRNVLCLTGDHHCFGNQKEAVGVFDLDSIQLLKTVRDMRDEGKIIGGEDIQVPPKMFIGAAANPFADPVSWRVVRLAKKVSSRRGFHPDTVHIQHGPFRAIHEAGSRHGVHRKGVHPCRDHSSEERGHGTVHGNKVAGMDVPEDLIKRMAGVPKEKQADEGIKIAVETIQKVREIQGRGRYSLDGHRVGAQSS